MTDIAIRVQNLSKCYQIYDRPQDRLKQSLWRGRKQFYREFWALKDVSFEIRKGETVGIIGRNGSGKSTLLQMICGTLTPTSGSIQTNGRIAALLELGSGFNPEFTGRENVYMNGAILGLSKEEIDARFDDIAAFADIGDFIEQPVKTYSSGMFVRLAFAVNIVVQPDIMIVDEALAVGDMNFQAKCMTALTRIQENGATVLFVSHDIGAVKSLCERGIYLESGMVKTIGKAPDVAELYIRTMREELNGEQRRLTRAMASPPSGEPLLENEQALKISDDVFKRSEEFDRRVAVFRYGTGRAKITYVELLNMENQPIAAVEFNQKVKIRIYFEIFSQVSVSAFFAVLDEKKNYLTGSGFIQAGQQFLEDKEGGQYLAEYILPLPLQEGNYSIFAQLSSPIIPDTTSEFLDVVNDAVVFSVNKWERARIWSQIYLFPILQLRRLNPDVE